MKSSFVEKFYQTWGFFPICGGDGTDTGDEGQGGGAEGDSGDGQGGDGNSGNKSDSTTFRMGGKELTPEELYEFSKQQFNENQRMRDILSAPEKVEQYYTDKFGNKRTPEPEGDPDEAAQMERARQSIKALGFITQEEQQAQEALMREEIRVENRIDQLMREIDGSDGRPKFDPNEIVDYLDEYGFVGRTITKDVLMDAYEKLHKEALAKWRAAKGDGKKSFHSERGGSGGGKPPKPAPKISFDGGEDSISVADAASMLINQE